MERRLESLEDDLERTSLLENLLRITEEVNERDPSNQPSILLRGYALDMLGNFTLELCDPVCVFYVAFSP